LCSEIEWNLANQPSNKVCTRCIQDQIGKKIYKKWLQSEELLFFEYFKASIPDLITLLSSGHGDGNGGNGCADPPL
jgi:hypothetical protein